MKKLIVLTAIFAIFLTQDSHAYLDNTHKQIVRSAVRLIKKVENYQDYEEIYSVQMYQNYLYDGAAEQDYGSVQGNQRSFRHYFDPDAPPGKQGCPYQYFYPLWQLRDLIEKTAKESFGIYWEKNKFVDVTEPPGGYYESALEWAWDSGGGKDLNNWKSAIRVYNYTKTSRAEAYRRLGHVIHLIGDCAQPDHVFNVPHPGSDREANWQDAIINLEPERAFVGKYYGYERFVEKEEFLLNPTRVERRDKFDDYFVDLARLTKRKLKESGLHVPLGLRKKLFNYGPVGVIDVFWTPTINMNDGEMVGRYIKLARSVLDPASEYAAGLMKDFHDIVNQPPYLEEIKIIQDGEVRYHAAWKDTRYDFPGDEGSFARAYARIGERVLERKVEGQTLLADEEAVIRLDFGPSTAPGEWIDSAAVKVIIGKNTITDWERIDRNSFQAVFTPTLREKVRRKKDLLIEVCAKDLHKHYPRTGLPSEGYELDSNPATPAGIEKLEPPYSWKDYEPGTDSNHKITIERQATPPIVTRVELFSGDKFYVDGAWSDIRDKRSRIYKEGRDVFHGGINIAETKQGRLRIAFDQELDKKTLRVKFGALDVAMTQISDTQYEGDIDFTGLYRLGLDDVITIRIEANNAKAMPLDSNPRTQVVKDESMDEWLGYEPGADTNFSVRVFHRLAGRHILKGRIWQYPSEQMDNWRLQRVFPFGRAFVQGEYRYWPPAGTPMSGGNILYGVTYCEITDSMLFKEFNRLLETYLAIRKKTGKGIFTVTQAEYRDYLKLLDMKEKLKASCRYKSGSRPDWKVPVGENGWFEFPLEVFPGENNVLYVSVYAEYLPPLGKPVKYSMEKTGSRGSRFPVYYPGYEGAGFVGEDELSPDFIATAPDFKKQGRLDGKLVSLRRQVHKLKRRIAEIKHRFPRPGNLEMTWKERARKKQKVYENEFKKEHGEADTWSQELKQEYMERLYEIPFEAKKSWKEDLAGWKEKREQALKDSIAALKESEKKFAAARVVSDKLHEEIASWKDRLHETVGDFFIIMPRDHKNFAPHLYELGGTFSGAQITPEVRNGYRTQVYLWKQKIDETRREKQAWGICIKNNMDFFTVDLDDSQAPKPPFPFKLNFNLEPEYLVINDFIDATWHDRNPRPAPTVGAGPVQSLSGGIPAWHGVLKCVDMIYQNLALSHLIEVEGYPVQNREKFDALSDEMLEGWAKLRIAQEKEFDELIMKAKSGAIDPQQLQMKKGEVMMKFSAQMQELMEKRRQLVNMNPAFDEKVKEEIFRENK